MERLTYFESGRWLVKIGDIEHSVPVADRLAAYEDTGLEPEEITTNPYGCVFYCNRKCNLDGDFCAEGPGCPHELRVEDAKHLLELAKAEKDGRLVVLPCKTGDILWTYYNYPSRAVYSFKVTNVSTLNGKTVLNTDILSVIPASDVGKTVFLTRAEAEAALERRKGEQDE